MYYKGLRTRLQSKQVAVRGVIAGITITSFITTGGRMIQLDEIRSQLPALHTQIEEVGGYL